MFPLQSVGAALLAKHLRCHHLVLLPAGEVVLVGRSCRPQTHSLLKNNLIAKINRVLVPNLKVSSTESIPKSVRPRASPRTFPC